MFLDCGRKLEKPREHPRKHGKRESSLKQVQIKKITDPVIPGVQLPQSTLVNEWTPKHGRNYDD